MKAVRVEHGGKLVYQKDGPGVDHTPLSGRHVLIQVDAIGVNRIDLYMAQGKMGPIDVIGVEASGIIQALGPECTSEVAIGDEVACLVKDGSYASHVLADERLLLPRAPTLSMKQMAAVPENWLTAYQLLHSEAQVQPGETILLHAAASGVGTAVIQLATAFGTKVIGTAGSEAKLQHVRQLGAVGAINYKQEDFKARVMELTENRGVPVVLDCVGESHAASNVDVLQVDGRWIVFGLLSGINAPDGILGTILRKRLTIRGTTLRTRTVDYQAKLMEEFRLHAWPRLCAGEFQVPINTTFDLSDVEQAHEYMKQNVNIGKIILTP